MRFCRYTHGCPQGGGKSRRSTPHPRKIPKKIFRFYVAGLLATFSPLWGTFFYHVGAFLLLFFSTWGPFWACPPPPPPPPPYENFCGPPWIHFSYFFSIMGAFLLHFSPYGGPFSPCEDLFATFFLHVGVSFGLPPPYENFCGPPWIHSPPPPKVILFLLMCTLACITQNAS